jgi:ribosomal 50S subunit-recycling heat shock protein
MTNRALIAVFCALLLVLASTDAWAAAGSTVLGQVVTHGGDIKVNGMITRSGGTIVSGDQVQTEGNTIAEVALNGGSKVLLPESSAVVLNAETSQIVVDLKKGALAVLSKADAPTVVEANGAQIKPTTGVGVVLEVAVRGNSLKVALRRGSATVETADKSLTVEEGKELDATLVPPSPQGPAGAGGGGAGKPHSPFKSKLGTYELIAAAGAGITGLILGIIAISRPNPSDCKVATPTGKLTCP